LIFSTGDLRNRRMRAILKHISRSRTQDFAGSVDDGDDRGIAVLEDAQ
jgi:hypothetical protein